jgi:hypothetical protein
MSSSEADLVGPVSGCQAVSGKDHACYSRCWNAAQSLKSCARVTASVLKKEQPPFYIQLEPQQLQLQPQF